MSGWICRTSNGRSLRKDVEYEEAVVFAVEDEDDDDDDDEEEEEKWSVVLER